jgi:hypothetical protein
MTRSALSYLPEARSRRVRQSASVRRRIRFSDLEDFGPPGKNFGDFWGPRATERYFLRVVVQRVEKRKSLKHRENTRACRVKVVSAEGIEPSTY